MLFRPAREEDLLSIHDLATESGITTLPNDIDLLKERLEWSVTSFSKEIHHPCNEYYLFVLEDPITGAVVGTSAIQSSAGYDLPVYSYKVSKHMDICHDLNIRSNYETLSLVNDFQQKSELCTLFLAPQFRHSGNGVLLSRARFLFIAQFPERFSESIFAEMRGVSDVDGTSPFWEALGKHFFQMSFSKADYLTMSTNKQFIADLMPDSPIHVNLLPAAAQAVIGKPHPATEPAMKILLREGFRYTHYVDIFDAGPTIEAIRDHIHTVHAHYLRTVEEIVDVLDSGPEYIIATMSVNFRASIKHVMMEKNSNSCTIDKTTAQCLQLQVGDVVRLTPLVI